VENFIHLKFYDIVYPLKSLHSPSTLYSTIERKKGKNNLAKIYAKICVHDTKMREGEKENI